MHASGTQNERCNTAFSVASGRQLSQLRAGPFAYRIQVCVPDVHEVGVADVVEALLDEVLHDDAAAHAAAAAADDAGAAATLTDGGGGGEAAAVAVAASGVLLGGWHWSRGSSGTLSAPPSACPPSALERCNDEERGTQTTGTHPIDPIKPERQGEDGR